MSIVRFNLQTPTLPVFIPQINLNPETNFGGTYPIESTTAEVVANAPFFITLYTTVAYPVGTVVYLANNNLTPTTDDASAIAQQYYRVIQSVVDNNGQHSSLQLLNTTATGNPSLYPGRTNFLRGGTQTVSYAKLPVAAIVYSAITGDITLTYAGTGGLGTLADLTDVYQVGDTIFINNSGQYNGRYTIKTVSALQITVSAPLLRGVVLNAYGGSGFFLPNGNYYDITPYNLTMNYLPPGGNLVSFTQPITFTQNDFTKTPPVWNPSNPLALSLIDITSEYYWVYIYESLINQVNQALKNCFWGLSGMRYATTGGILPMTGITTSNFQPPSISWDSANDKGVLTADNNAFGLGLSIPRVFLYFNQPLATLFDSFPYDYTNVAASSPLYAKVVFNTSLGAGFFIVQNYGVYPPSTTNGYLGIQVYQDHQTSALMNPVQSIVFTSTILPVVMENVGQPSIINGTSTNQQIAGSSANIFPIVTDFIVPFSATNQYVPDISYVPSGEYRLVDLYGESPANQIDIQVYWKDQYGILHPFLLGSGCSGSLKVMFRRKSFNNTFEQE